jgi:hypothetical protein
LPGGLDHHDRLTKLRKINQLAGNFIMVMLITESTNVKAPCNKMDLFRAMWGGGGGNGKMGQEKEDTEKK